MQAVFEDLTCYLPVTLHKPGLSEAEWISFCDRYADFRLEYTAEGSLLIMPGTEPITGRRNAELTRQLGNWAIADGHGESFDSSTSFLLPSSARRSDDSAGILRRSPISSSNSCRRATADAYRKKRWRNGSTRVSRSDGGSIPSRGPSTSFERTDRARRFSTHPPLRARDPCQASSCRSNASGRPS